MRTINQIILASENKGKLVEFQSLAKPYSLQLVPLHAWVRNASFLMQVEKHLPQTTYLENATYKCKAAFQAAKVPTIADDSGLEILGLEGAPGILSANYAKAEGNLSRDQALRKKVLTQLAGKNDKDHEARFVCVLVFMVEGVHLSAEGVCEGKIITKERGENGFGYDSIFVPKAGDGRTMAEMSLEEKNKLSHRTIAFHKLVEKIKEENIQFVRP